MSLVDRGAALLDAARPEQARVLLAQAVGEAPEDDRARCLLALALLRCDQPQEALEAANGAVATAPDEEWTHRLASLALAELGQSAEAVRAAREAVRLDPQVWAAHRQLAATLRSVGQLAEAEAEARRALGLASHESEAHSELGRVLLARHLVGPAQAAFRAALEQNPADAVARHELARAQLAGRDYAGAVTGFGAALGEDPTLASARHNIDLTVRVAVSRVAVLAALACFLTTRVVGGVAVTHPDVIGLGSSRLLMFGIALAICGLAIGLGGRHYRRLPPPLRPVARQAVRADKALLVSFVCLCLAVLMLLASSVAPGSLLRPMATAAGLLAILARLSLYAVKGVTYRVPLMRRR